MTSGSSEVAAPAIDDVQGANELYTGMGATMGEDGRLGGREVMIEPNGPG